VIQYRYNVYYLFQFHLQILGKAEFLNPGGSVKDRVAVKIIEEVAYLLMFPLHMVFAFHLEIGSKNFKKLN
jgi:hypothetical protein